jgi:predicted nucleic acid-binding protein
VTTYLVDANILSEPTKPRPDPNVVAWLKANQDDFVVDAVVLGEIAVGIFVLAHGRRRALLERWFEAVTDRIDCLAWDAAVSLRWGQLVADLKRKGKTLPVLDSMIAATALVHGLTVATHNVRDFRTAGVSVVDPFG